MTVVTVLFIVGGGVALFLVPRALLLNWIPGASREEQGRLLGTAAQLVLFALGGVIAAVGVALSLSRHRQELLSAQREREDSSRRERTLEHEKDREVARRQEVADTRHVEQERSFRERFVGAVGLVAQDNSRTQRTAGIGALASLADDWLAVGRPDEAQLCVEMICAHIRSSSPTRDVEIERHVKLFAMEQIRDRLSIREAGVAPRWAGLSLNLSGMRIDIPMSFEGVHLFTPTVLNLSNAQVVENAKLSLVSLTAAGGQIDLSNLSVEGSGQLLLGDIFNEQPADLLHDTYVSLNGMQMAENAKLFMYVRQHDRTIVSMQDTCFGGSSSAELTAEMDDDSKFVARINGKEGSNTSMQAGLGGSSGLTILPGILDHTSTANVSVAYGPKATAQVAEFSGIPGSFEIRVFAT